MNLSQKKRTIFAMIVAGGIFCFIGAASAGSQKYTIQYKTKDGQSNTSSVAPEQVRIISRKENMAQVCVEIENIGQVWVSPALWMVSSPGGDTRQSPAGGRVAGTGNGFGSIREIPVSPTCG